jgi:hypothetical protein
VECNTLFRYAKYWTLCTQQCRGTSILLSLPSNTTRSNREKRDFSVSLICKGEGKKNKNCPCHQIRRYPIGKRNFAVSLICKHGCSIVALSTSLIAKRYFLDCDCDKSLALLLSPSLVPVFDLV